MKYGNSNSEVSKYLSIRQRVKGYYQDIKAKAAIYCLYMFEK